MEPYNSPRSSRAGARQAQRRRARRRKQRSVQLLAITAPLLAALLFLGWNSFTSHADIGPNSSSDPSSSSQTDAITPPEDKALIVLPGESDGSQLPEPPEKQNPPEESSTPSSSSEGEEPTQPVWSGSGSWNLTLVNPWTKMPQSYEPNLTYLKNGHAVDERCYASLQEMMDACKAAGLSPIICSSYRTQEKQQQLFNNQVQNYLNRGYSQADAEAAAGNAVALPGTSEHQLGLAVDIVDVNNQNLNSSQENTPTQQWLMQNSWQYGFILRYPSDKSAITGIMYEPWHYRYVGKEVAQYLYENGICLEEYLDELA